VAQLAQRVAVVSGAPDPDTAYLAGLLHDLGKPVVATILLEAESQIVQRNPKLWIDFSTWISVVQRCHRAIGLELARKWQLPDEIQKAIEECTDYDSANRLSTGNAVRFANAVAKQQGIYAGPVKRRRERRLGDGRALAPGHRRRNADPPVERLERESPGGGVAREILRATCAGRSAWLARDAAHGCEKKIGLEGLHDPALGPGALGPGDEVRRSFRGQHDDGQGQPSRVALDGFEEFETVHAGHVDVAQDHGDFCMRAQGIHALPSVTSLDDLVPRRLQRQGDLLPNRQGVVHYEYGLFAHDSTLPYLKQNNRTFL
jgi:putative nucleotidyltransferase with HDIG domain